MPSPMTTVIGLTILWLVVVVPMIVRRPAGLPRGHLTLRVSHGSVVAAGRRRVPGSKEAPVPSTDDHGSSTDDRDFSEMSATRRQMLARRRRALAVLIIGSVVCVPLALITGGIAWLLAVAFLGGLVGYLYFLRNQARRAQAPRTQDRHLTRQDRMAPRKAVRRPEPMRAAARADLPESAVRIDDDDFELQDTVDLTGLYDDVQTHAAQRRAS